MNVREIVAKLRPIVGVSSLIGAPSSTVGREVTDQDLAAAREELGRVTSQQANAGSDYAYWGYEGQRSYWQAVVDLLEAASLLGSDELPVEEHELPDLTNGVVMDLCGRMTEFAAGVLAGVREARKMSRQVLARDLEPGMRLYRTGRVIDSVKSDGGMVSITYAGEGWSVWTLGDKLMEVALDGS